MKLKITLIFIFFLTIIAFFFIGCCNLTKGIEKNSKEFTNNNAKVETRASQLTRLDNILIKNTNCKDSDNFLQIFGDNQLEVEEIFNELLEYEILNIYNLFRNGNMLNSFDNNPSRRLDLTEEDISLIEVDDSLFPDSLEIGESINLRLKINNLTDFPLDMNYWENDLSGYHIPGEVFELTYHWYDTDSDGIVSHENNAVIIDNLQTGEVSEIDLKVVAPSESGIYTLRYALKWGSLHYYLNLTSEKNKDYRKIVVGGEEEVFANYFNDKTPKDRIELLKEYVNNNGFTEEGSNNNGYLTVTNISEEDLYYQSVEKINDYRNGKIIKFENSIFEIADEIKNIDFYYMGILVKPEDINEDFIYDVFRLNRALENDYKKDYTYGFITGITASDTMNYISNLINYEEEKLSDIDMFRAFWHTGEGAAGGGYGSWGDEQTNRLVDIFSELGLDSTRINTIENSNYIEELKAADILLFNLHGLPYQIEMSPGEYLHSKDLDDSFNAKIVLNTGCFGACTVNYYDQCAPDVLENYQDYLITFPKEEALSLNFLKYGALAYFGHFAMWGDNGWPMDIFDYSTGGVFTSGELIDIWYEKHDIPEIYKGRDWHKDCGAGIILFGDPAAKFDLK